MFSPIILLPLITPSNVFVLQELILPWTREQSLSVYQRGEIRKFVILALSVTDGNHTTRKEKIIIHIFMAQNGVVHFLARATEGTLI